MNRFRTPHVPALLAATAVALLGCLSGCGGGGGEDGGGREEFVSIGTAPVGGAFNPVGQALAETLNNHEGDNDWKVQAKGTKGSQENIRMLEKGEVELALSNSAISYHAVNGTGAWDKKYDIRALVTMAPNVAMFITKADSGISSIAELAGKRVVVGPAGAGFDMFVGPILEEHGITFEDFSKLNDPQSAAVDKLGDGNADAAFLGGAVPTGSIVQACASYDIVFVPFDDDKRAILVEKYPFFEAFTIPQDKYADLEAEFDGLNVGSMHLITSADLDEDQAYEITKIIWENRDSISHPAAKAINEKNAAKFTGTPFHPGAIKFYEEIGIWEEPGDGGDDDEAATEAKPEDESDGDDAKSE